MLAHVTFSGPSLRTGISAIYCLATAIISLCLWIFRSEVYDVRESVDIRVFAGLADFQSATKVLLRISLEIYLLQPLSTKNYKIGKVFRDGKLLTTQRFSSSRIFFWFCWVFGLKRGKLYLVLWYRSFLNIYCTHTWMYVVQLYRLPMKLPANFYQTQDA